MPEPEPDVPLESSPEPGPATDGTLGNSAKAAVFSTDFGFYQPASVFGVHGDWVIRVEGDGVDAVARPLKGQARVVGRPIGRRLIGGEAGGECGQGQNATRSRNGGCGAQPGCIPYRCVSVIGKATVCP